jgi:WD40 repeat protein
MVSTLGEENLRIWGEKVRDLARDTLAVSPDGQIVVNSCEIDDPDLSPDWEGLELPSNPCEEGSPLHPDIVTLRNAATHQLVAKLTGHDARVVFAAFDIEGSRLATLDAGGGMNLWTLRPSENGSYLAEATAAYEGIQASALRFLPGGKLLATDVGVLDLQSGQLTSTDLKRSGEEMELAKIDSFSFTPDGGHVASLVGRCLNGDSYSATVTPSGKDIDIDARFGDQASAVAFSPDGTKLAVGHGGCSVTSDFSISIINMVGKKRIRLADHEASVTSVSFSPNGKLLVSGSDDGTAKLWDVASGRLLATLFSLEQNEWVVVMPDGRFDTNRALDQISGLFLVATSKTTGTSRTRNVHEAVFRAGFLTETLIVLLHCP